MAAKIVQSHDGPSFERTWRNRMSGCQKCQAVFRNISLPWYVSFKESPFRIQNSHQHRPSSWGHLSFFFSFIPSHCLPILHICRSSLSSSDPLFVCLSLFPSKRIHFQVRGSEDIQRQLIKKKKKMTSIRQDLQTPSSKRTLNLSRLRRS